MNDKQLRKLAIKLQNKLSPRKIPMPEAIQMVIKNLQKEKEDEKRSQFN